MTHVTHSPKKSTDEMDVACDDLHNVCAPSTSSKPKIRYDSQNADTFQESVDAELCLHFVPLIQQHVNVVVLADTLVNCLSSASHSTMPITRKRHGAPARRMEPWYDQACRDACKARDAVERIALSHKRKLRRSNTIL